MATEATPLHQRRNFAGLLWQSAAQWPSKAAVVEAGQPTPFEGLAAQASGVAAFLANHIGGGDRVGIFLDRGAQAAAAFFGVLAAGGVAININERLRPRQVEHILADSGARVLLTSAQLLGQQPRKLETDIETAFTADMVSKDWTPHDRAESDLAHIIYTSGSTGLPKGVMVSHGNLWAGTRVVSQYLGLTGDDRIASLLPFSFDYGLNQLLCALKTGATLFIDASPLPQQIVDMLRTQAITVLPAVPPTWLQLLTVPDFRKAIPSIGTMTNTGGRIPTEAVRALRAAQPQAKLFLMYGLTEAFRATYLPPHETDRRPDSIGKAIPESEIIVIGDDGKPCAPGQAGELVQAGPTVALGYWNNPEATARVFRPHPLQPDSGERAVYSGDLVRTDHDGYLYFVSRRDRMIKSLGFRVSPDEILEVLYRSGEIVEAAIATEPDSVRGTKIIAHVVLTTNGSADAVKKYCRTELPGYAQPARIEIHDALPRTSSGKHDVSELA
jgi:amino acid adenylation domain-containing protein